MEREQVIKSLIAKTGMSLKAFANSADVPYTTLYSMLERGIGKASVDNVIKVCKCLGITVEQLFDMAKNDTLVPLNDKNETKPFTTVEDATEYLIKLPSMAAYGGYDIKAMSDEEIIEFANELLHQFELISHKYKK